jgi:hypothetical protein
MLGKQIDLDIIKTKKIMIATPLHDGRAHIEYIVSLLQLYHMIGKHELNIQLNYYKNHSLITFARNNLANDCVKNEFDYLFFIDSDIGFNVFDFLYAIQLSITEDKKIICATYPKKRINWERIHSANKDNEIKLLEDYEKYSLDYATNFFNEKTTFDPTNAVEVFSNGTGFMLISKDVFLEFSKNHPEKKYIDEETKEEVVAFFDCEIDKDTNMYLSEDINFCKYANNLGFKIWLLPWVNLSHTGIYTYKGNLIESFKN